MKKSLTLLFIAICLFSSCAKKKSVSTEIVAIQTETQLYNPDCVITYYDNTIKVMQTVASEKGVNEIISYIKNYAKGVDLPFVAMPDLTEGELAALMNPGSCFDDEVRTNLKTAYADLFTAIQKFRTNFEDYTVYDGVMTQQQNTQYLDTAIQLGGDIMKCKQQLFEVLQPVVDNAFLIALINTPSNAQIMAVKAINLDMLSVLNLYNRRFIISEARLDAHIKKLGSDIAQARNIPSIPNDDEMNAKFNQFLDAAQNFLNQMEAIGNDNIYTDERYEALISAYGTSII